MQAKTYLRMAAGGSGTLVAVAIAFFSAPWLVAVPHKMADPLQRYLIYDESQPSSRGGDVILSVWRQPTSRAELLMSRDYKHQSTRRNGPWVLQTGMSRKPPAPKPPLRVLKEDSLEDFVVDRDDCYAHPKTQGELEQAIKEEKAQRSSAFFGNRYVRDKPFCGDIPLRNCFIGYETESGFRTQLQVWKNFKLEQLSLPRLKTPQVFVAAAGGAYNAQVATCQSATTEPVAFPNEQFWAAIYAGSGGSSPAMILLDRASVSKESATITIYRPPRGASTADVHAYWFFVPLGRLAEGDYSISVRLANDDSHVARAEAKLRYATEKEIAERGESSERQMAASDEHFDKLRGEEIEYGAELQLRLERLAEFISQQDLAESGRRLLTEDVQRLGAASDWNRDIYQSRNYGRRPLEPATPGQGVKIDFVNPIGDYPNMPWNASRISLSDIWLCAGPETNWYVAQTYRRVAELDGAMAADEPTDLQRKVRAILTAIEVKANGSGRERLLSMIAVGTLEEAIESAYRVYVNGKERQRSAAAGAPLWAVMIAPRSVLIRQVNTRQYRDSRDPGPRREFRVYTSAYVGRADNEPEDESAVSLALIPLGEYEENDTVGVHYSLSTVCCRKAGMADEAESLVDVRLPDLHFSKFWNELCSGAYVRIEAKTD